MAAGRLGKMHTSLEISYSMNEGELAEYVARQMSHFFPDREVTGDLLAPGVENALARVEYCFSHIHQKYFVEGNRLRFNHLHTDQYAMFLGYLGNALHRAGDAALAAKAYALNKALHALDVFYSVELPDIFYLQHPVGTVLGRAKYANYFFAYQRCSVGGNIDLVYPTLGEGVVMYGGSALIGNCTVGENCWLSIGTIVKDQDLPPNSVVFGCSPQLAIKATKRNVIRDLFNGGKD